MELQACSICFKPKAKLECGVCKSPICKNCTQFLDEASFEFLNKLPDDLTHKTFCHPCFEAVVEPNLQKYNNDIEKARNVFVFYKTENKESRYFKRGDQQVIVKDCPDKEETILRLAFQAVQLDCNVIVDVDLSSEKVKSGSYQTSKWKGSAFPVQADPSKLEKKLK